MTSPPPTFARRRKDPPRPPTTPVEVLSFTWRGVTHAVAKQTWAGCVGGIDNWRLHTHCGHELMVTAMASRGGQVDCLACVTMSM